MGSSTGEYRSRLRMLSAAGQLQGVPPQLQVQSEVMLACVVVCGVVSF